MIRHRHLVTDDGFQANRAFINLSWSREGEGGPIIACNAVACSLPLP